MKKPWKSEPGGAQLEAFLGCWGAQTSSIESSDELRFLAAKLYELPNLPTVAAMAKAIENLGKKDRKLLASKNFEAVFGERSKRPPDETAAPRARAIVTDEAIEKARTPTLDALAKEIGMQPNDLARALRRLASPAVSSGGDERPPWE